MKKLISVILVAVMIFTGTSIAFGTDFTYSKDEIKKAKEATIKSILNIVKEPEINSSGGEWAIVGLARAGAVVPKDYYDNYYKKVQEQVVKTKGILHDKKYTEYSRVIIALTAIGKDPRNVAGYDLTYPLGDYEKTIWQGLNGPIWALLALDSGNYPVPTNKEARIQATREMYIQRILDCQLSDGGWSLTGGATSESKKNSISDPDITGMALQALAKYKTEPDVGAAIEEALACMSKYQREDAGFYSGNVANLESVVQIVVALCQLGISQDDVRFNKNGESLLDNMMSYYIKDEGFKHTADSSEINLMATEQGLYALAAVQRFMEGKNSLYDMTDVKILVSDVMGEEAEGAGLVGKHVDVIPAVVKYRGRTFADVNGENAHVNQRAIEALAERDIINGKGENRFDPDANMNRAEFATIVVKSLGLKGKLASEGAKTEGELAAFAAKEFSDVKATSWYGSNVATAFSYDIVRGVGNGMFRPEGTITRQEAAVMVVRAAKLCGLDTELSGSEVRDVLAQFGDYTKSAEWSRDSLAYCYSAGLLDESDLNIMPSTPIKRAEIAEILYRMLEKANLIQ